MFPRLHFHYTYSRRGCRVNFHPSARNSRLSSRCYSLERRLSPVSAFSAMGVFLFIYLHFLPEQSPLCILPSRKARLLRVGSLLAAALSRQLCVFYVCLRAPPHNACGLPSATTGVEQQETRELTRLSRARDFLEILKWLRNNNEIAKKICYFSNDKM